MNNLINGNSSPEGGGTVGLLSSDDEISLIDLLQTIVDNLRLLVFGPLIVGLIALAYGFTITPIYTAKTLFLPPQQQQSAAASLLANLGSLGGLAGTVGGIKNPTDQFLTYMRSVTLQDSLVDRFKLLERYSSKTRADARAVLTGNVRTTSGKDGLISVEVDDKDPKFAADLANAHVEELGKLLGKLATTEAQQRRLFFEKQLNQAKDKLALSEIALKSTGVSGTVLKSNPASAVAAVAGLQASVTAQEVKIGAMRGYLAESAADFKLAMSELSNLKAQLAKQEKDSPLINGKIIEEGDYITKFREYKYNETLFDLFSKQLELAKVDEAREGAVIQVLDPAEVPERKAKPKKATIAIFAALVTAVTLIIFVFLKRAFIVEGKDSQSEQKIKKLKDSLRNAIWLH